MDETVGEILVSRMEWRVNVLDGWKGGYMESWMIMWKDIMNILQSAKEIWRCEQLQETFYQLERLIYTQVFEHLQNQRRRTSCC